MAKKKTLGEEVSFSGIGVHSGRETRVILKPSSSGRVVFRLPEMGNLETGLNPQEVDTKGSTSIIVDHGLIRTVEHLMAVIYALEIDSLVIEVEGGEIPIMDGSALPLVQAVSKAGISYLSLEKKYLRILKPCHVQEGDALVSFYPDPGFRITYSIEYDHPVIRRQELSILLNQETFSKEVAPARTFGFLKDVPRLKKEGLALGGSLENAVVLDEKSVINGPLRFQDEFVRHKILDLVGDLSFIGYPVIGHINVHKGGHSLHFKAIRFFLEYPEFWTII